MDTGNSTLFYRACFLLERSKRHQITAYLDDFVTLVNTLPVETKDKAKGIFAEWAFSIMDCPENYAWMSNAYHNPGHCMRVAIRAMTYTPTNILMKDNNLLALMCAGLWHDFNYVPCKEGDSENIPRAVQSWKQFYKKHEERFGMFGDLSPNFSDTVIELICSTYYPYTDNHLFRDTNKLHVAMRDADLTEILHDKTYGYVLHGLYEEFLIAKGFDATHERFTAFKENNAGFLKDLPKMVSPNVRDLVKAAIDKLPKL